MSVEAWKTTFDFGAVILLFLTFVSGVGALITTNIINRRQAVQLQKFDSALAQAKRDIALADKEAAQANEKAEKERLARIQLEEALAWRRLTKEQKLTLGGALKHYAGQEGQMVYSGGDRESEVFALDIFEALKAAQWAVFAPATVWGGTAMEKTESRGPSGTGVFIMAAVGDTTGGAPRALVKELEMLGFDASISRSDIRYSGKGIQITVETRPLGPQGAAKLRIEAAKKKP